MPFSLDLIFKKLPCQQLPLHRLPPLLPLSLLRRYAKSSFGSGHPRPDDLYHPHYLQEKPKEKTIFNVKLESFDPSSKPKVIKEVKAMVPNLTLIEVRSSVFALLTSKNSDMPFSLFRQKSLLSRCQRFLRRTCQRRTPRSSRRCLRASVPLPRWSDLSKMLCLHLLLSLHDRFRHLGPAIIPPLIHV